MRSVSFTRQQIHFILGVFLVIGFGFSATEAHQCSHGHDHHVHQHDHGDNLGVVKKNHHQHEKQRILLPEEIAEEEDLKMMMWDHNEHDHDHGIGELDLSEISLWIHAMGCSLLVSLASLICLILLPIIFIKGKPSKSVVDSLALFGAGAMLGDAFLHQLPHAFGGGNSHSHDHHDAHDHNDDVRGGHSHSHSHSLKDLSIGLSILGGIILFLLVEKLVRYINEFSGGSDTWTHGHHHHHHHTKQTNKLKEDGDEDTHENDKLSHVERDGKLSNMKHEEKSSDTLSADDNHEDKPSDKDGLRKRNISNSAPEDVSSGNIESSVARKEPIKPKSSLVFGYLNLFSDGVHNFTDGMALGSAFLLHGSVGGWSRTLFLLAHELPQEIGDFGILVRSGFSVSKALFFNFLSALVALAGTALALILGKDIGQSSVIEGFTAGGFIYIAIAGVLAEMNNGTSSSLRSTALQLTSLLLGMGVALFISLVE